MPIAKIYQYFGEDRFDENPNKPRKHVGEVEAQDLEGAYYAAQHDAAANGCWSKGATSCVVGDVIEFEGKCYLVKLFGFQEIDTPTGNLIKNHD